MPLNNPQRVRNVATGNYPGDNANDRQITTGFKCSFVMIQCDYAHTRWTMVPNRTVKDSDSAHNVSASDALLHADNGFVVDKDDANLTGLTYWFWAISE